MKIGIDARFVGPQGTGLGKYTEKLIENIQTIDNKNDYVIFLRENNWSYLKLLNKNFKKSLADVPWYTLEEQLKMTGIYRKQGLDLLHIPHFNVPLTYNLPFVVTIHDLIHHKFSEESATTKNLLLFKAKRVAYKKIITHAIKKSRKIITPSNYVKSEILKTFHVHPEKIAVTYEAAEDEYFSVNEIKKNKEQIYLLYVGNTYPHKNISKLLNSMLLIPTNIRLKIVCPRDVFKNRLQEEIKAKNLENRVDVLPYQDVQKLKQIFYGSSAYLFPSLEEGFGIPGLNAMAAGVPVIASNIPTLTEVYKDAAIFFDPKDEKDIAKKIKQVLTSQKLQVFLSKKGSDQAKKYSWLRMAKETIKIYENSVSTR